MDSLNRQRISAIARLAASLLTALNAMLAVAGKNPLPFTDDQIGTAISVAIATAAQLWAWWKDNVVTSAANIGHSVTQAEKQAAKSSSAGEHTDAAVSRQENKQSATTPVGMTESEVADVLSSWQAKLEGDQ